MSLPSVLKKIRLLLIAIGMITAFFFIYQIPGDIRIQWQEHDVSFSFLFGIIFSIVAIFIVNMSYSFTHFLLFFPEKISKFLKDRTQKNLFHRLTASLNDYAGGNPKKILKLSHYLARQKRITKEKEAQDPAFALTHVLLGYVAYQQNDFKLAEQLFQKIQSHKETKMLSTRGLLMVFQQKSPHKVKDFVSHALEEFPESNWLQMIDFEIKKNEQDYVGALESLKYLRKTLDDDQMSKEQATIEWHLAEDLRSKGDFKEALTLAYSSYKKDPNPIKCMKIADLNRSLGHLRQAEKILFKEYTRLPNYTLVKDFLKNDFPDKSSRRLKKMLKGNPDHVVSKLSLAIAALNESQISKAQEVLNDLPQLESFCHELSKYDHQSIAKPLINEWIRELENILQRYETPQAQPQIVSHHPNDLSFIDMIDK